MTKHEILKATVVIKGGKDAEPNPDEKLLSALEMLGDEQLKQRLVRARRERAKPSKTLLSKIVKTMRAQDINFGLKF